MLSPQPRTRPSLVSASEWKVEATTEATTSPACIGSGTKAASCDNMGVDTIKINRYMDIWISMYIDIDIDMDRQIDRQIDR